MSKNILLIPLVVFWLCVLPVWATPTTIDAHASDPSAQAVYNINQFWLDQYGGQTKSATAGASAPLEKSAPSVPGPVNVVPKRLPDATLSRELLAKAQPDECFYGIGDNRNGPLPCQQGGQPKVNGGYVWGMTQSGNKLWWGTLANSVCTVLYDTLGLQISTLNNAYVCEGQQSHLGYPGGPGDWRLPEIYSYDLTTHQLQQHVLSGPGGTDLGSTMGLRAAGAVNDIVLLAGPAPDKSGIYVFAFRSSTGVFLGSQEFTNYTNVRGIKRIGNYLYMTVTLAGGSGAILRWTGASGSWLTFDEVGTVPTQAAFMAEYEGHLFVDTWPSVGLATPVVAGVYMSPAALGADGWLPSSTASWTVKFSFAQYEPDQVTALSYAGGAMASYGGYLYFGTMHFPAAGVFAAYTAFQKCIHANPSSTDCYLDANGNGQLDPLELLDGFLGTYRATSVFRGSNFTSAGSPDIRLVYGYPAMPVYDTNQKRYTLNNIHGNSLGQEPQLGLAGFNDFFNLYSWTMATYQGKLFVGSFDWTYLLAPNIFSSNAFLTILQSFLDSGVADQLDPALLSQIRFPLIFPGADIYRFDDTSHYARPEALGGLGNIANYGIRTMVAGSKLWVGTANPMNLLVNNTTLKAAPTLRDEGGWEVFQLSPLLPPAAIPALGGIGLGILLVMLMLASLVFYMCSGIALPGRKSGR